MQVANVSTTARVLRRRGHDGAVPSREKVAEACRGPFITLRLKPESLQQIIVRQGSAIKKDKKEKKASRPRRKTPYSNGYRFEFAEDRFPEHQSPSPNELQAVMDILAKERPVLTKAAAEAGEASTPFHGSAGITMDSIVRVILSHQCTNDIALIAQQQMIQAYQYYVDGKWVMGKKPNYHAMRVQGLGKLQEVISIAGLYTKRPHAIKAALDMVYLRNVRLLPPLAPGEIAYDGNELGASDFVPGTLSVDFLWAIHEDGGKQALMDYLLSISIIGVKSAACLMQFNMGIPVFAVDTHVAAMAKLLG